jgi:hypothetical protein
MKSDDLIKNQLAQILVCYNLARMVCMSRGLVLACHAMPWMPMDFARLGVESHGGRMRPSSSRKGKQQDAPRP